MQLSKLPVCVHTFFAYKKGIFHIITLSNTMKLDAEIRDRSSIKARQAFSRAPPCNGGLFILCGPFFFRAVKKEHVVLSHNRMFYFHVSSKVFCGIS